jgi:hypothetical protein
VLACRHAAAAMRYPPVAAGCQDIICRLGSLVKEEFTTHGFSRSAALIEMRKYYQ